MVVAPSLQEKKSGKLKNGNMRKAIEYGFVRKCGIPSESPFQWGEWQETIELGVPYFSDKNHMGVSINGGTPSYHLFK